MNWMYELMGLPTASVTMPGMDCGACTVKAPLKRTGRYSPQSKCCEFSPFVSSFALGYWQEKTGKRLSSLPTFQDNGMLLTALGVLHPLAHRKQEDALCHFFNSDNGFCRIWQARPATCFTFFCAHENEKMQDDLSRVESVLMIREAEWLKPWAESLGVSADEWQQWIDYLDGDPETPEVPEKLRLASLEAAEACYLKSWKFLNSMLDHSHESG